MPRGIVARTPEEAEQAAKELGTDVVVVKAQIHAGGRGKAGGVKVVKSIDDVKAAIAAGGTVEEAIERFKPAFSALMADDTWLPAEYMADAPESGMGSGIGQWALDGSLKLDLPVMQGFIMVGGVITLSIYLLLDVIVGMLDPRVSYD